MSTRPPSGLSSPTRRRLPTQVLPQPSRQATRVTQPSPTCVTHRRQKHVSRQAISAYRLAGLTFPRSSILCCFVHIPVFQSCHQVAGYLAFDWTRCCHSDECLAIVSGGGCDIRLVVVGDVGRAIT